MTSTTFTLQSGPISILTLHSPNQMNLLFRQTMENLYQTLQNLKSDPELRVLILTGGRAKAFCAGANIHELVQLDDTDAYISLGEQLMHALYHFPVPVIAAVNGYALGAGFSLATACEFRLLADNAKIGQLAVRNGLVPPFGDIPRLATIVGTTKARELVYTGQILSAAEALACGLVSSVHTLADLLPAALALAEKIAQNPPFVIAAAKEIFNQVATESVQSAIPMQVAALRHCFQHPESLMILRKFLDKAKGS